MAVNKVELRQRGDVGVGAADAGRRAHAHATMRRARGADSTHTFEATPKPVRATRGTLGVAGAFALNIVDETTAGRARRESVTRRLGAAPAPGVVIVGGGAVVVHRRLQEHRQGLGEGEAGRKRHGGHRRSLRPEPRHPHRVLGNRPGRHPTRGPPLTRRRSSSPSRPTTSGPHTEATRRRQRAEPSRIVPAIAITLATILTSASLGASATALTAPARGSPQATQTVNATTTAKGVTNAGSTAGIGVSLALAVIATSTSIRAAPAASPPAAPSPSRPPAPRHDTVAEAAAKGAAPVRGQGRRRQGRQPEGRRQPRQGERASSPTESDRHLQTNSTPKAATNEDSGSSVSIAGAIAINVVSDDGARAWFANGIVVSSGGIVTLKSLANTDVLAKAKGDSAAQASVGIGAGVAVQGVDIVNRAITGNADHHRHRAGRHARAARRRHERRGPALERHRAGRPSRRARSCPARRRTTSRTSKDAGGNDGLYTFGGSSWNLHHGRHHRRGRDPSGIAGQRRPLPAHGRERRQAREQRLASTTARVGLHHRRHLRAEGRNSRRTTSKRTTGSASRRRTAPMPPASTSATDRPRSGSLQLGHPHRRRQAARRSPTSDQVFRLWEHEVTTSRPRGRQQGLQRRSRRRPRDQHPQHHDGSDHLRPARRPLSVAPASKISALSNERDLAQGLRQGRGRHRATGVGASVRPAGHRRQRRAGRGRRTAPR